MSHAMIVHFCLGFNILTEHMVHITLVWFIDYFLSKIYLLLLLIISPLLSAYQSVNSIKYNLIMDN